MSKKTKKIVVALAVCLGFAAVSAGGVALAQYIGDGCVTVEIRYPCGCTKDGGTIYCPGTLTQCGPIFQA